MALTREEKEGFKVAATLIAIVVLFILAISAVFYGVGKLDDGMASPPSQWSK